jgi:uncharacterized membrane protein YhaH (DUF805 family)
VAGAIIDYLIWSLWGWNSISVSTPWGRVPFAWLSSPFSYAQSYLTRLFLYIVLMTALTVFYCMLAIKRAHDRDRPSWFVTLSFMVIPPLPALWALVELGFLPGSTGDNAYGNSPLGHSGISTGQVSSGYQQNSSVYQQNAQEPVLVGRSGEFAGSRIPVGSGIVIGRDPSSCNLVLSTQGVSRTHARVTWNGGQFVVTDLRSTNGVYVSGSRINGPVTLTAGASFRLGKDGPEFVVEC